MGRLSLRDKAADIDLHVQHKGWLDGRSANGTDFLSECLNYN